MDTQTLTILVYLALTTASGLSLWLFLTARREVRRLKKGNSIGLPANEMLSEVLRLRSAGLDASRIARKLGVPPGEIQFVLALESERSQRTTTFAAA